MNEFLQIPTQVYVYLGIWPLDGSSKFFEKLRYALGLFFATSIAIFNVLEYIGTSMQWGDWETFCENISLSLMFTITLAKIYIVFNRRDEIVLISKEIDSYVNEIFIENNQEKIAILLDYQRKTKIINNFLRTTSLFAYIFICLWPISIIFLNGDYSLRPLIIQAYFPFSLNATGNYIAAYIIEIVLGFVTALHAFTFEMFFVTCILFAVARIKILQYSIERVNIVAQKKFVTISKDEYISDKNFNEKFQINVGIRLKKCIEEHQRIGAFCKTIDSIISLILFILCFSYSIIISMAGICAIHVRSSLILLKLGLLLSAMFAQIILYFWHGDELITESREVANSAWKRNWYNFGKSNIKTIIFIISRSQKEISLSVGKFHRVDLPTLLSLISTSYSYFALLKQFYE